ncbi:metallophosphoesterase [Nannocystis punicea]|uniref:Metallophosphoesterase n=1 Tax=Nannocystis punicea TaxID=2995304 RepID=A0ABY7GUB0_9BACT|nr:metallophosphoesterase [Nannocystis poenicansa]WAS90542.1 metallophosphoesterase [Nannocystis poenicansa]
MTTSVLLHPRLAVISDLHVGDPETPELEDFDRDDDFVRLLSVEIPRQLGTPTTLVINGDFIDFPQVLPALSRHDLGDVYGTTEAESLRRFERARDGHPRVFQALADFIRAGNQVCLLPGNHDPDYHWPSVEAALRTALGNPRAPHFMFIVGGEIHERGIHIEHGNQYSYDNRFDHWDRPILDAPDGPRLERPWGTLFMDLVYNDAEAAHRTLNRIYPHGALAAVVARSFVSGQVSLSLFARVVGFMLGKGKRFIGKRLLGNYPVEAGPPTLAAACAVIDELAPGLPGDQREAVARAALQHLPSDDADAKASSSGLLGWNVGPDDPDVSAMGLLGRTDERGMDRRARDLLGRGDATIVAFGHTHLLVDAQAPYGKDDPRRVFNTGSWVPQLDVTGLPRPTLDELDRVQYTGHELRFLAIELGDPPRARLLTV